MKHKLNKSKKLDPQKGEYWLLIGRYEQRVYDALMGGLPPHARWWDPKLEAWKILDEYEPIARKLLDDLRDEAVT